jgi:presqualene diphosphate synthase
MLLMPAAERAAMFAVYTYCRQVDDIADDGTRPRAARAMELEAWRADFGALYAGKPAGRAAFLETAIRDFKLRQ